MPGNLRDETYDKIYRAALDKLEGYPHNSITTEVIKNVVAKALEYFEINNFGYDDTIVNELQSAFTVKSSSHSIITREVDHVEWYDNSRKRPYWETYAQYLKSDKKYSLDGVNAIDRTTDLIMKNLEAPSRDGIWDTRGLVVGSIQSGKTSNFIGLINKAVDAGYQLIVVLSGLNKNLRQQTQKRTDDGFLAYNTMASDLTKQVYLPLYKKRSHFKVKPPICLTTSALNGDFGSIALKYANVHVNHPRILVIKKNKTILQNVIKHFVSAPDVQYAGIVVDKPFTLRQKYGGSPPYIKKSPILVIDDEVDNGSVDTGEQYFDEEGEPNPEYDPKTINRLIRQLLHIFEKKCYIGYTATPFANIFIHESGETKVHGPDLFPRNFIIDLPVPSNHSGIEKLFPKEMMDYQEVEDQEIDDNFFFEIINDHSLLPEDRDCDLGWMPPIHDKNHYPMYNKEDDLTPPSLKRAILSFFITSAVRNIRGYITQHKSMLIHVTKFVKVQDHVFEQVTNLVEEYRNILNNENASGYNNLVSEMKSIWKKDFVKHNKNSSEHYPDWNEIMKHPKSFKWVTSEISKNIKKLNGTSDDVLDYEDYLNTWKYGMHTIVIGGDKLSRGLTLEGLSVSYFLRSAKMPMYDTLMQMGRWFGYRQGYEDLCRLYTTKNVIKWFFHISVATEELRSLFRVMSSQNATPKEFGLRVRDHPILRITSKTKMRHARIERTCYSGTGHEFISFKRDEILLKNNFNLVEEFIGKLGKPKENKEIKRAFADWSANWRDSYQWINVETEKVVNFLRQYHHFVGERGHRTQDIATYIETVNRHNELKYFTVSLFGNGSSKIRKKISGKYDVELLIRKSRGSSKDKISLGVVTTEDHEAVDLLEDEYEKYKNSFDNVKKTKNKEEDKRDLEKMNRGLIRFNRSKERGQLNIYPIHRNEKKEKENTALHPLFAISLSLPNTNLPSHQSSIPYQVNTIYRRKEWNE